MMTHSNFVVLALLLLYSVALSNQDELLDNSITSKRPTNEPPTLHRKFKKLGVIAGKPFRYIIPPDAFTDLEDGSNLTYTVFKSEHVPLSQESWLQFNSNERILYGLPLIEHVNRWNYIIEAKDSDGGTAQGTLDIRVQLHRRTRNNNHQFTMKVKPLKRFQNTIDWQIRALEGIANIHKDANFDHLLVLNVTQIGDVYEFTWMNDTPPQYPCPVDDIKKLMKVMESETEHGSPSSDLINAMSPDLQVLEITWRGTGQCATIEPITPNVSVNYPPILRNTIDHLTARVGHLLVYRVPEDTFFDPEDGSTRSLHLSLRFSDNSPIPPNHWLQFDAQKQELSGVPSPNDVNDVNYVLIAEDSDKNVAYDNIHVELQRPTNEPPTLHHKFKKLGVIAGKPFRYIIPPDAFTDLEDGSNLTYTVFKSEHVPLSQESWLQFNSNERILYGLPLIEHVDRWNYIIEAKDSDGGTAQGTLDIRVQLHRRTRNNNHQFTMKVKPLKRFQNTIDWQIRALEGIANIHKDANFDHLLVLNVTQLGDVYEFTWMNDTLPQYPCPVDDIKKLMKVMESETEHGSPSSDLINAMSPDLQVLEITLRETGQCATIEPITPNVSANYPPILRNTIDHLTARVGHLLVYRVPEDTFFDPEDGSTRSLHLSLRFSDNSPIPSNHWLQFDAQKQELSGVPSLNDVNDVNYVLIAEDSDKNVAYDNINVIVETAIKCPTIELQVIIEPSVNLLFSANNKRKLIEKVTTLLGENDTNSIRIKNVNDNPSTITLYNFNLGPKIEIDTKELHNTFTVEVSGDNPEQGNQIGKKDVKITSFRIIPISSCTSRN